MSLYNKGISMCVVLCSLAVVFTNPRNGKPCGGVLRGMFGQIKSPKFPEKYPDYLNCSWKVKAPAGFSIRFNFTDFDLENYEHCSYDYVLIKGNNNSFGHYCGSEKRLYSNVPTKPIEIASNVAEVQFNTDHSNEEIFRGFVLHFAAEDVNECLENNGGCLHRCHNYIGGYYCTCRIGYDMDKDLKKCLVQCEDKTLTNETGIIQSPEYPNDYPPFADCKWHISTTKIGHVIELDFEDFNIEEHPDYECPYDWLRLEFEDGSSKSLCGDKVSKKIFTNRTSVRISFHTDMDENRRGFKLRYQVAPLRCPVVVHPKHGHFDGLKTFRYPDLLYLVCDEGYLTRDIPVIMCNATGQWSTVIPNCEIRTCPEPKPPTGGTYSSKNFNYGSILKYSCGPLYNLVGNDTSVCLSNGSWSGPKPTCKPICGRTKYQSDTMEQCRGRIVNGNEARKGSQPWIAAIYKDLKFICGGSLINDEWILTAAHCITKRNGDVYDRSIFKIFLGKHDLRVSDADVQEFEVAEVLKNPDFRHSTYNADVALMRLANRAIMTEYVRPVCLPSNKEERSLFRQRRFSIVAGWGRTEFVDLSQKLREVCIPLANRSSCANAFKDYSITHLMFCAGKLGSHENVCKGDSGGPLVAYNNATKSWVLGGIVSWGSSSTCGQNYEVFSRVTKFIGWIQVKAMFDIRNPFS